MEDTNAKTNEGEMKMSQTVTNIENLTDGVSVRVHFADGTTLRMSRKSYESGSWKKGTDLRLVAK